MPATAAAQSITDTTDTPTLAQELSAAPKPGKSSVTATIGGEIQDGRTETKAFNAAGVVAHTSKREQLFRFDIETTYARYREAAGTPSFVATDNQLATLTYLQPYKKRYRLFGMTGWRRDAILELDYRAWIEAGAGTVVVARPKVNAFVGGSFSAGKEHREHTDEGSHVADVGFLQNFNFKLTNLLGFEEWYKGHWETIDTSDHSYNLYMAFLARVSKHAGLKIYYKRQFDSLHPPSVSATQSEFGAGVQITFSNDTPPAKP